jgi:hypothetical protein
MLRPIRLNSRLLDPVKLQQVAKYRSGLTVTSNDTNIIPRNDAGNIQLEANVENNPLLIIEPVATRITLDSVLKVLDTQFEYFKFPATIRVVGDTNVDVDLTLPELDIVNNVDTELKLPVGVDDKNQPVPWDRINTSYDSNWFYSSGFVTKGFKELPFTGDNQLRSNAYTLTKDVIDTLRQQNKTLKFTIQTQYVGDNTSLTTGFVLRLNRDNIKSYRPWLFPIPQIQTTGTATNGYPVLGMEFILNADDLVEDDYFVINVVSGNPAYSLNDKAYWKIEAVDIPTSPPLFGIDNKSGVYNIQGGGSDVILSSITYDSNSNEVSTEIGRKIPGSNEFIFK